ncbi:MAG: ATP synthase F0 subunit B [Polyangiaceae bacterium]
MRRFLVSLTLLFALSWPLGALANEHGHEGGHGDEHAATFDDVNWFYGLLGEQDGLEEPDLLWRPKGMPVPFAALAFDSLLLYFLLYRVFGRGIADGLRKRKEGILRGMDEAAKMKREAEAQLQSYEEKLASVDQEVLRIQTQMRKAAEIEHARILSEAKERRERMERDAHLLVQQELKAVRESLIETTITSALKSAEQTLRERLTASDQERFGDEYVAGIRHAGAQLRGRL